MATRVFAGYRLFKDNGDVCNDGTIAFYLAGTTTPQAVYSDKDLTTSLGTSVSLGSLGIAPDIFVSEDVSIKAVISGTGVTQDTIDYLTVADSTAAAETTSALALGNVIANGAFQSWTAGTSFSNISGDGDGDIIADGWYFTQPAAASNAISRQTASGSQARYCLRFGRPNLSTSTNELRIWQMLDTNAAYRLRGQEVTISFTAKAGANFSGSGLSVRVATGTAEGEDGDLIDSGGFTGHSSAIDQTQAITTTATRYEFTATLGASIKEVGVQFSWTGAGTAGANDWVEIEDVQLEIAADATSFKFRPEQLDFLSASLTTGGRLFLSSTFTDPGADVLAGWDDSAGAFIGFSLPSWLTTSGTALAASGSFANYLADPLSVSELASITGNFGTAAFVNTGTSGGSVPLLNAANTWSAAQTLSAALLFSADNTYDIGASAATRPRTIHVGTSIELGAASDTTITRASAGVIAVEGVNLLSTTTGAQLAAANTFTANQVISKTTPILTLTDTAGPTSLAQFVLSGVYYHELAGTNRYFLSTTAAEFDTVDLRMEPDPSALATNSVGFRGAPVNEQNTAYTLVLTDAGKTIYHNEVTARVYTIPANASVAFPVGTTIIIDNTGNSGAAGTITLSITTDTLRRGDGVSGTGSRTIAASAVAAIRKVASTTWVVTGTFS